MALPAYTSPLGRIWHYTYLVICAAIFIFLIAPILVVLPLSFNVEPYFTFTKGMLDLDPKAYTLHWYANIIHFGMAAPSAPFSWDWLADMWNNSQWIMAMRNSFFIATVSTVVATILGTIAALGLSKREMPFRTFITGILISPMIVPVIITATGMFFFYSSIGLAKTYPGIILAHATLGVPFVIITVTATLSGFDRSLIRAAQNLGANSTVTFSQVILPLILPGMISGALFAFVTSLDDVVVVLFLAGAEQKTIPRQMWSGIREQISPTILAVATILIAVSIGLLTTVELLRRRTERLRGLSPA